MLDFLNEESLLRRKAEKLRNANIGDKIRYSLTFSLNFLTLELVPIHNKWNCFFDEDLDYAPRYDENYFTIKSKTKKKNDKQIKFAVFERVENVFRFLFISVEWVTLKRIA